MKSFLLVHGDRFLQDLQKAIRNAKPSYARIDDGPLESDKMVLEINVNNIYAKYPAECLSLLHNILPDSYKVFSSENQINRVFHVDDVLYQFDYNTPESDSPQNLNHRMSHIKKALLTDLERWFSKTMKDCSIKINSAGEFFEADPNSSYFTKALDYFNFSLFNRMLNNKPSQINSHELKLDI